MVRLKRWQWVVLAVPIAVPVIFLLFAAGRQIHAWRLNWIWAVFTLLLLGWRWLLVKWTKPAIAQIAQVEAAMAEATQEMEAALEPLPIGDTTTRVEAALQTVLQTAQADRPIWEDWQSFWTRCQELVTAIANIYHPEVKYPLLNIYIPQAYGLMRGTTDDMDEWMQKVSPALNQITVGQAVQAYEVYRRLEPSARKLWKVWSWAQWLLNPVAAVANQASQQSSNQATQQLLVNLGQSVREVALRNLARQAITLYGSPMPAAPFAPVASIPADSKTSSHTSPNIPSLPQTKTQTLREILSQAEPVQAVEQKPVSLLLVGRTGAGKSSLINTLFHAETAAVDVLPSTDRIQQYQWQTQTGEQLILWDTPGYEQANRSDFRAWVLEEAAQADLLLLLTPALDPALQMDVDFLSDLKATVSSLPTIAVITQVDRLRPVREWQPPYDWQWGDRPKEIAIREAAQYRAEALGNYCDRVLPIVTADFQTGRTAWGDEALSLALIEAIAPAQQLRLARFLRNLEARSVAAAQIIDRYSFQMATTQGLAALLKSPVLQFISTVSTGSPRLAVLLAAQIPVEQLPIVIGKLQMTYDLYLLLQSEGDRRFDLLALWPLLTENATADVTHDAWALGHALVEYWTQDLSIDQVRQRVEFYLQR
ncbi:50S ribosome-binding GTPase [Phormidium tenue FACHB-886]|nr:50S ribosome-binding GTPase [Phormidium tenue FACHB-886]